MYAIYVVAKRKKREKFTLQRVVSPILLQHLYTTMLLLKSFCSLVFLIFSIQEGVVCMWSLNMKLLRTVQVIFKLKMNKLSNCKLHLIFKERRFRAQWHVFSILTRSVYICWQLTCDRLVSRPEVVNDFQLLNTT